MSHDLTLTSATFNNSGKFSKSRSGGYGQASTPPITGKGGTYISFTAEFWFKANANSTGGYIFSQSGGLNLFMQSTGWFDGAFGGEAIKYGSAGVGGGDRRNGQWTHIAIYADGINGQTPNAQEFYVNGIKVSSEGWPYASAWGAANYQDTPFFIGAKSDGTLPFDGEIDEVVFTLGKKYTSAFTPPTAPVANNAANLLALYHFNGDGIDSAGLPEVVISAPGAPTNVVATVGGSAGTASVTATAPASDGGSTITGYEATASTGQVNTGATLPIIVSGLSAVPTTFTVKAINGIGPSVASAASNSITPTAAPVDNTPPTLVSATTSVDGTGITMTFSETLAAFTPTTAAFPLTGKTIGGIQRNGATVTLTGISPAYTYTDTVTLPYVKPGTNQLRDAAGNDVASFSSAVVANAVPAPPPPGVTIKTVGAGKDFASLSAAQSYANSNNWVTLQQKLYLVVYENQNVNDVYFMPQNSSADYFVTIMAAGSVGVNTIDASGPFDFNPAEGLTLTGGLGSFTVGKGVRVEGFNIDLRNEPGAIGKNYFGAISTASQNYGTGGTYSPNFANCRILARCPNNNFFLGGYGVGTTFNNCLIIQESNYNLLFNSGGAITFNGCAIVRRNGTGTGPIWGPQSVLVENSFFINCGSSLNGSDAPYYYCRNNFSDTAVTGSVRDGTENSPVGITVSANLVVNPLSDYTPAVGSALLGGGNWRIKSTNDMRGNNRGANPDAGPLQRTPAQRLVVASLVGNVEPDGQGLVLNWTTQNTPTSGYVSLIPVDHTSGGVDSGPYPITLGSGTAAVTIDAIQPGLYLTPTATFINDGGPTLATGGNPFEIIGMDAVAEDTTVSGPANGVLWSVATSGVAGTPITIAVGLNGTSSATVRATFDDNGADGNFSVPYIDIVNGVGGTVTYTKPSAGAAILSLTNNVNFTNPASVTFTAAAPPAQAPAITITTALGNVMSGKTATLSGAVDLKGDVTGHVDVYLVAQGGQPVLISGITSVSANTWTKQFDVAPGLYQFLSIATANGQTTTAPIGPIRVLGLTGNFTLPTA